MTMNDVLSALQSGKLTLEDAQKQLSQLSEKVLSLKTNEDGEVVLLGLRKGPPVSLTSRQWERVLNFGDEIKKFIAEQDTNKVAKTEAA